MSALVDPITRMTPRRGAGGIVRWTGPRPVDEDVCIDCGVVVKTAADRCPRCSHTSSAMAEDLMAVLERNLSQPLPLGRPSCECGCLLLHDLELCPACSIEWARRDEVRWSWRREWWAA